MADRVPIVAVLIAECPVCRSCLSAKSGLSASEVRQTIASVAKVLGIEEDDVTPCEMCSKTGSVVYVPPPQIPS